MKENKNRILTKLPTKGSLTDWKSVVGMDLDLFYNGEVYNVKVIKYENGRVWVDYNGYICEKGMLTGNLLQGKYGAILKLNTGEFKYSINQEFKDNKRNLKLVDKAVKTDKGGINRKYYKYTCNKCGWTEGWIEESSLKSGSGCLCCTNQVAVLGINTIWDTDRWMVDLGMSEEDAKRHTPHSNKKIEAICPDCGCKKNIAPNKIYDRKTISCSCGDGRSYPEKLVTNVLMQLGIEFETQLSVTMFNWCGSYRYDFYAPSLNMMIETHGLQHYEERSERSKFKKTIEEVRDNDRIKKELAINNHIKHYIVLDCRYSELEWIKKSILESKLKELFDLSNIDWNKCEEYALKNIVKEVCDYWNQKEEWETTSDLAKKFNTTKGVICGYVKRGNELGWCNYNAKEEMRKSGLKSGLELSKQKGVAVEVFKDGISFGKFKTATELAKQSEELLGIKLIQTSISKACRNVGECYKGFTFVKI